jgi:hypothetical protein
MNTERYEFTTNDGTNLIVYIKHDDAGVYWWWLNMDNIGTGNCFHGTSFGTGDQYYAKEVATFINKLD